MFVCGDWKWGHFRQHCNREYRTGETCGMKLVHAAYQLTTKCKLCEKIETKFRRRQAEVERYSRWQREGGKFKASMDKSLVIIKEVDDEIRELQMEVAKRRNNVCSGPATR